MKLRCTFCREYRERDEFIRESALVKLCSESCVEGMRNRTRKSANRKPSTGRNSRSTDGLVPEKVRASVYERDNYRCRYCGAHYPLHLHHVVYRSQGGRHEDSNLLTLCPTHHELVHSSKQRFQHLLLGVIWMTYKGKRLSIPQFERWFLASRSPHCDPGSADRI